MNKSYIYIHICCINNWVEIVSLLFEKIKESGLYNHITKIRCVILGNYLSNEDLFKDNKIEIIYHNIDIRLHEKITINIIYDTVSESNDDFNILYIHSKGVKHNGQNQCVKDWVDYLIYFNIENYRSCLEKLKDYDVVGVNLNKEPCIHYSGNFWWSKASHVKKIGLLTNDEYIGPEKYITQQANSKFFSFWTTTKNLYNERLLKIEYEDKILNGYEIIT